MSGRPAEEFRVERSGPILFGILGVLTIGFAIWLAPLGLGQRPLEPAAGGVLALMGVIGVALGIHAIRRALLLITIAPDGIRFKRDGELHPWRSLAGLKTRGFLQEIRVVDAQGVAVGVIPAGLARFERAVLLSSLAMPIRATGGEDRRFEGDYGRASLLAFIFGAGYFLYHFSFAGLSFQDGPGMAITIGLVIVVLVKVIAAWRRTGTYEITVGREGVRFRGRSGEWQARWGELREVVPQLQVGTRGGAISLRINFEDGRRQILPIPREEIHEVLTAFRALGGTAVGQLIPPLERPDIPLFKRNI